MNMISSDFAHFANREDLCYAAEDYDGISSIQNANTDTTISTQYVVFRTSLPNEFIEDVQAALMPDEVIVIMGQIARDEFIAYTITKELCTVTRTEEIYNYLAEKSGVKNLQPF